MIWENLRPAKPDPPFDAPSPTKKRSAKNGTMLSYQYTTYHYRVTAAKEGEDVHGENVEGTSAEEADAGLGPDEDTVVEVDSTPFKRTRFTRKMAESLDGDQCMHMPFLRPTLRAHPP